MGDEQQSGARWDAAQEGAELLREGEIDAAISELTQVIAADPNNEYALYFLGAAQFEKGRFDRALKAYVEALRLAPEYVGAMVGAGHALRMMGRHAEALKMVHQVLGRDRDDPEGLHLAALVHYARGERHAAAQYLDRFLRTGPELEVAQEAQGLLAMLRGEVQPMEDDKEVN